MLARRHVEAAFFDGADELRRALDETFAQPYGERYVWQYFFVPQLYAYWRARLDGLVPAALAARFTARLDGWAREELGLAPVGPPLLHLMVSGCSLSLHSDFHNGSFGYVYSLTRWSERRFSGGETLLLDDGVPSYKRHHAHGDALYETVPHPFNQLLLFDDRIVHATSTVLGSMDPREGRLALVGHLRAAPPSVNGPLPLDDVRRVVRNGAAQLTARSAEVQGVISVRGGG
jgi:hypothetical protein